MFDSSYPPLLAIPVSVQRISLFPYHEGYREHQISNEISLCSFKEGWILPLSAYQKTYAGEPPVLLVRSHGKVTTAGSTFNKGFAHWFCREDGSDIDPWQTINLFQDKPDEDWMLVRGGAVMIWFQSGEKSQFCGSGSDIERHYYGKLLIRSFEIKEDFEPRLDKSADIGKHRAGQYRVESNQIHLCNWDITDSDPAQYLREYLIENKLERFENAVMKSLDAASGN